MVAQACNSGTQEVEAGEPGIQLQSELCSKTLSPKKKKIANACKYFIIRRVHRRLIFTLESSNVPQQGTLFNALTVGHAQPLKILPNLDF
jgi:hypothetical protein